MEEYDDLSQGPSNDGTLDLSHNTWKSLPPELNDFTQTLLHLDLKNNQLTNIESIGNLILLRSLDVSFNQLSKIPESIGKCIRLRRLNVAHNQLTCIDEEVGNCILLEEIIANDNQLMSLPKSIVRLFVLSVLDLRNNRLTTLNTELSRLPTFKQLLCEGNPQLTSAPEYMRSDSKMLLHCLEMQQKFKDVIDPKEEKLEELKVKAEQLKSELKHAKTHIAQLEKEVATLEWERPDQYIYCKGRFLDCIYYIRACWVIVKDAFVRWKERRRTHPLY